MSKWGNLEFKYQYKRQRKMLAIDGGGIRGVLSLEILKTMETQLRETLEKGEDFRLSDYFDYIGGTSTGAIIAAGLATGMSVDELLNFYQENGNKMFKKSWLFAKFHRLYDKKPLINKLKEVFGEDDINLNNGKFKSLLLVVTMNRTTNSPWPISNNPLAKYNAVERPDCNLNIPLYQLVRASTAAPVYFAPEELRWDPTDPKKTFQFVDGGVTPYNNPSFLMYRMATQGHYGLNWEGGEKKLMIVSVGTGAVSEGGAYYNIGNTLKRIPNHFMYCNQVDQDINCRTIGKCVYGAEIDREVGQMISSEDENQTADISPFEKQFTYARYNADLSDEGIKEMGLKGVKSYKIKELDAVDQIENLRKIGKITGDSQVDVNNHFKDFLS